jgi:copper chaperone CopZ
MNIPRKCFLIIALAAALFSTDSKAQAADSVLQVTIKVANLHCNNDMPTIKKRLINQDGIDEVSFTDISGTISTFTISYHNSVTNPATIEKLIETTPGCDDPASTPYKIKRDKNSKKRS